jgi:hypothetical protein
MMLSLLCLIVLLSAPAPTPVILGSPVPVLDDPEPEPECENDPGYHPLLRPAFEAIVLYTANCPGTGAPPTSETCLNTIYYNYLAMLLDRQKTYQQEWCLCWELYPEDVERRNACQAEADGTASWWFNHLVNNYKAAYMACCAQNRPTQN